MGCDIHTIVETRQPDLTWQSIALDPPIFDCRTYGLFGFLANVRNYSHVPCIKEPLHKWPDNIGTKAKKFQENNPYDCHSYHSLTLKELQLFDYDQTFEDRRVCRTVGNFTNGAALADEGDGEMKTIRNFLGEWYFSELERLNHLAATLKLEPSDIRVLMSFDN